MVFDMTTPTSRTDDGPGRDPAEIEPTDNSANAPVDPDRVRQPAEEGQPGDEGKPPDELSAAQIV